MKTRAKTVSIWTKYKKINYTSGDWERKKKGRKQFLRVTNLYTEFTIQDVGRRVEN